MAGFVQITDPTALDYIAGVTSAGRLKVEVGGTPAGTQDVNLTQVAGVAVRVGAGATGTGSERVTVAQDITTIAGSAPGTAGTASANVLSVQGPTASASAVAANPTTIGGRAATTNPTAVADGQVVNAQYSKTGKAIAIGALRTMKSDQQTQISNSTSETTIVTAGAAGVFNDLYGLILANTGASTTKVTIRDGTGGTIRAIIEVPTLETRGFMLPVDSGFSQAAAAVVWTAQCDTATTALEVTALFALNS